MKRVFLLRAYGDFIVALQSIVNSPIKNEFEIIASRHHLPLFEALQDSISFHNIAIRFEDWKIQKPLLRLFTDRYLLHTKTLEELKLLRNFFQKETVSEQIYFIEQQNRQLALEFFTGKKFTAISKDGFVYASFHNFFKTEKSCIPIQFEGPQKILILPSARIQRRDLPIGLVQAIQNKHIHSNDRVTVAYFKNATNSTDATYQSFPELMQLISSADFVYGADSLPIHLSYLLRKPHFILYPNNGSHRFFTPYVLENQFFSTFDGFK